MVSCAGHSTPLGLRFRAFQFLILMSVCLSAAGFIVAGGPKGAILIVGALLGGFLLIQGIRNVVAMVVLTVIVSATSGGLGTIGSVDINGTMITVSGLMTSVLVVASVLSLVAHLQAVRRSWLTSLLPFLFFSCWVAVRTIGSPSQVEGLRDTVLISTPILLYLIARIALTQGSHQTNIITASLLCSPVIPLLSIAIAFFVDDLQFQPDGLITWVGRRPMALFAMIILCVALAEYRNGSNGKRRMSGLLVAVVSLVLILITLSRTATATTLVLIIPIAMSVGSSQSMARAALAVCFGLGLFGLVLCIPAIRTRYFGTMSVSPEEFGEVVRGVNTYGRDQAWAVTWESYLEAPIVGKGTGAARDVVEAWLPGLVHPHNDYLRVLHDQGVPGLVMFIWAWGSRAVKHFRGWRRSLVSQTTDAARYHMASALATMAIVGAFITDNCLVYVFVLGPVFVLFAAADSYDDRAELMACSEAR